MAGKSKKDRFRVVLRSAAARNELVRVVRTLSPEKLDGYVVDVGPELFLMCVVSDEISFNGFCAMRVDDLEKVWSPAPHHLFVQRALALRSEQRPVASGIDASSLKALLQSAAASFPLLTLHRERIEPDVCHIGRLVIITPRAVTLREISPDATWDDGTESYDLREITRVDFGGRYEDALITVNRAT